MTTQPMPLEETMGGLSLGRKSFEITGSHPHLTAENLPILLSVLSSALHHLEAGKRDSERLDRLQSCHWVDIRNKDEDWENDGGLAAHLTVDLPKGLTGRGKTLREAIDNLPTTPTEEPQG